MLILFLIFFSVGLLKCVGRRLGLMKKLCFVLKILFIFNMFLFCYFLLIKLIFIGRFFICLVGIVRCGYFVIVVKYLILIKLIGEWLLYMLFIKKEGLFEGVISILILCFVNNVLILFLFVVFWIRCSVFWYFLLLMVVDVSDFLKMFWLNNVNLCFVFLLKLISLDKFFVGSFVGDFDKYLLILWWNLFSRIL